MMDRVELYKEFYHKVSSYVRSKVPFGEVEDVVSNVFLKVYSNLGTFDENKASLSTWIYTISHNTVVDYYKGEEKRPLSLDDHLTYVSERKDMDDMLDSLSDAMEKLNEVQKDVVILHYYYGLQHTEIAKKLNLSPANTRKICSLALESLRFFLKK